jgi:ankyrin repeat protein
MEGNSMRIIGLAVILVAGAYATAAFSGDDSAKPQMTRAQARAYLKAEQIDPSPDSLAQQILSGDVEAVDAMVAAGVDVNATTSMPQSSLELAGMTCAGGRVATEDTLHIMNTLIVAGANPNTPGMAGLGPLMVAAQQCKPPVVKRLIAAGAKLDSRTPQGFTPLSMALIVSNYDAAEALIDGGARLSVESGQKLTQGTPDNKRLNDLVARATKGP